MARFTRGAVIAQTEQTEQIEEIWRNRGVYARSDFRKPTIRRTADGYALTRAAKPCIIPVQPDGPRREAKGDVRQWM